MTRPTDLRAGFHAVPGDEASGLHHAGEQWAAPRYLITPHTHGVWEFYLQVHGITHWAVGGDHVAVRPGELMGVPTGVTHHMAEPSSGNYHFYFAAVDVATVLSRNATLKAVWRGDLGLIHERAGPPVAAAFEQLAREVTTAPEFASEGLFMAVDLLVLQISRLLSTTRPVSLLAIHPAVTQVRELLERDYERRWTLDDLARLVGLAPTYLSWLFTSEVGSSPHAYLLQQRIDRARQLLETSDLPITAIGLEVGFSSSQHFARVFRKHDGRTPSDFRAKQRRRALRVPRDERGLASGT